jgi:DNA-binding transcriptional regulator YdaS (Cro superfamily)
MENVKIILSHYGTQEAWANAWGVTPAAVSQWVAVEQVPVKRLVDIYYLTNGALRAVINDGRVVVVPNTEGM